MRFVLCAVFAAISLAAFAQNKPEERAAVLKYGIESEVLEVVRALRQEANGDYRGQLKETYAGARSDELKQQILLLFSDLKDGSLEEQSLKDLGDESKANAVRLTLISYLTDLKSTAAVEPLMTLTTGTNKVIASASLRALGKLGAADKAEALMAFYRDAGTDPNLKPDVVWALGEMKAPAAADLLSEEYDSSETEPLFRRNLLEALGKIGGDKAWATVSSALTDANADVRSAAVGAVGGFPGKADLAAILTPALRDAQTGVRLAAAQAAQPLKEPALKDLLAYRMRKDPDPKVRAAAMRAVAAYDDGPADVLALLGDRKSEVSVWREALTLALDKGYPGTMDTLRKVLEEDSKDKTSALAPLVANALLAKRDAYRALFGQALASDKPAARLAALRAVSLGKYTEYADKLKSMAASDPDAAVKAQASTILSDWNKPEPTPAPEKR